MLVFQRHVLITRALLGVGAGELDCRRAVHIPVVKGVTSEQRVVRRKPMVDSSLREILIGWLRRGEEILRHASSQVLAVGLRKQVEIRLYRPIHFHLAAWQRPLSA